MEDEDDNLLFNTEILDTIDQIEKKYIHQSNIHTSNIINRSSPIYVSDATISINFSPRATISPNEIKTKTKKENSVHKDILASKKDILFRMKTLKTENQKEITDKNYVLSNSTSNKTTTKSGSWTCSACTLINSILLLYCDACRTSRYSSPKIITSSCTNWPISFTNNNNNITIEKKLENINQNKINQNIISNINPSIKSHFISISPDEKKKEEVNQTDSFIISDEYIMNIKYEKPENIKIPNDKAINVDSNTIHEWIYPTNYSIRQYQLNMVHHALYENILVSLPTGLGKTLIAAVVMLNYYRWFPNGKILFMGPTRPLVSQQIQACHDIVGIPLHDIAELMGNISSLERKNLWFTKRVFFCTPQSVYNDIELGYCKPEKFVCVVIDEAHRATGNYAYCTVLRAIASRTSFFRVLALSATPGAKVEVIQEVINNLYISKVKCKSADDPDVKKYMHERHEEVVKCSLSSFIMETKVEFLKFFYDPLFRLNQFQVLSSREPDKIHRYEVLMTRERLQSNPPKHLSRGAIFAIISDLNLLITLIHTKNLLLTHGIVSFKKSLESMIEETNNSSRAYPKKLELIRSEKFQKFVDKVNQLTLNNDNVPEKSPSHPKLAKLREILTEHFKNHETQDKENLENCKSQDIKQNTRQNSRVIVFTQFRSSVIEIVKLLNTLEPLIKAQPFIGQSHSKTGTNSKSIKDKNHKDYADHKGQNQKQQQEIVSKFRAGIFNVLVATCIAEEGLDIGEVDLIISFDALTSPVRMIQRMGRTGRKKVGKVIILITEGEEEKKLVKSRHAIRNVNKLLTNSKYTNTFMYHLSVRMIPDNIFPKLKQKELNIQEFRASQVAGKSKIKITNNIIEEETPYLTILQKRKFEKLYANENEANYFSSPFNISCVHLTHSKKLKNVYQIGHSPRTMSLSSLLRSTSLKTLKNYEIEDDTFYNNYAKASKTSTHPSEIILNNKRDSQANDTAPIKMNINNIKSSESSESSNNEIISNETKNINYNNKIYVNPKESSDILSPDSFILNDDIIKNNINNDNKPDAEICCNLNEYVENIENYENEENNENEESNVNSKNCENNKNNIVSKYNFPDDLLISSSQNIQFRRLIKANKKSKYINNKSKNDVIHSPNSKLYKKKIIQEKKKKRKNILEKVVEMEAEVEHPSQESPDEIFSEESDMEFENSFIDDSTQMTQILPTQNISENPDKKSSLSIRAIYARSLMETPESLKHFLNKCPTDGIINKLCYE